MLKNIIAPVQAWLLSQGRCVGCGTVLSTGSKLKLNKETDQVTCKKCGRVFLYIPQRKNYQRAPVSVSK